MVCGYIHRQSAAPDECPICGAAKSYFEAMATEAPIKAEFDARTANFSGNLVVLGAGIAGISAVEAFRKATSGGTVTLITKESSLPYYRLNLTRYLAGEIGNDELPIHDRAWYDSNNVDLKLGEEVADISLGDRRVIMRDGSGMPFDRLIITIGAHPFVPPLAGAHREGVTALRTLHDARLMLKQLRPGMTCAVVGGGILGLEAAGALAARGAGVSVIEGGEWLMPRQLNKRAGEILLKHVNGLGIKVVSNARTKELIGDERVMGVLMEDGRQIPADLVVVATGVRPNSQLARRAGLAVKTGVIVDNHLRSSHPSVYAAGDVAEHMGVLYGNWTACQYQGGIAGINAAGGDAEFGGIPRSNSLKVLGLELSSIGKFEPDGPECMVLESESDGEYIRFVFKDRQMIGAVLIGDAAVSLAAKDAIEGRKDFSGVLAKDASAAQVAEGLRTT